MQCPASFTVRPIEPERDSVEIAGIYNHYVAHSTATFDVSLSSPSEMAGKISAWQRDGYPCLVAVDNEGHIAGYCYAHPWKQKEAYGITAESTLYIHPGLTSRGLGTLLMNTLIQQLRSSGRVKVVIACITEGNLASVALHLKLGFRQVSLFKNVGMKWGQLLDVTDFQLDLTPIC